MILLARHQYSHLDGKLRNGTRYLVSVKVTALTNNPGTASSHSAKQGTDFVQ